MVITELTKLENAKHLDLCSKDDKSLLTLIDGKQIPQ